MDSIVLDAMGVVFQSADDVAELLIPFIKEHAGEVNIDKINDAYISASLGEISANEFWHQVCVPPKLEDLYLSRQKNVQAAIDLGIPSRLFQTAKGFSNLTESMSAGAL